MWCWPKDWGNNMAIILLILAALALAWGFWRFIARPRCPHIRTTSTPISYGGERYVTCHDCEKSWVRKNLI